MIAQSITMIQKRLETNRNSVCFSCCYSFLDLLLVVSPENLLLWGLLKS
jgi:hypothetical protein